MKAKSIILSTGLAMFSMFFGSGNLVFPLLVGQMSEGHYLIAALGMILTGVLVPFLGILAMFLFDGEQNAFFGRLGEKAAFWMPLFLISMMGPFGVLARCITVSHGAFLLILPHAPLWLFSLFSCLALFLLTIRKNKIVPVLGSVLTPIFILFLGAIVYGAIASIDFPSVPVGKEAPWPSFNTGVFLGYQTMDLLASFFFSAFIIQHLKKQTQANPKQSLSIFFKSSLIGGALLTTIYAFLVLVGAMYAPELTSIPPQEMLGFIAQKALGPFAAPVVCIAMILACLTTAMVLTSLFADFLKKEIAKDRISNAAALIATLSIAFCISTLGFSGIAKWIGPVLQVCYPALIVLTLLNIFQKLWGWRLVKTPTVIAFLLKLFSIAK